MTHKRKRIRDAVVSMLEAIPGWNGRVFSNRARPTEAAELPTFLVYSLTEDANEISTGGTLLRDLTIAVELRAAVTLSLDDTLDGMAEKVEVAMAADRRLGKRAVTSRLTGTTIGLDGEGESRQAVATLTYVVQYQTDGSAS